MQQTIQSHKPVLEKKHLSLPFLCLWWVDAESATTHYPKLAWSTCHSVWTAVSKYVQISFDLAPILVWPSEGCLSGTRHLGDPEPSRMSQIRQTMQLYVLLYMTVPD